MKVTHKFEHCASRTKTVHVEEIHPSEDDNKVLDFALEAVSETRSSTFGADIDRRGSKAIVHIYTD